MALLADSIGQMGENLERFLCCLAGFLLWIGLLYIRISDCKARNNKKCIQYLDDMKFYIERFGETIFDASVAPVAPGKTVVPGSTDIPATPADTAIPATPTPSTPPTGETELFYYTNPVRGTDGKAEIGIHLGHSKKHPVKVLAGSKVSRMVSDSFSGSVSVKALRAQLENQGILVDGVLTEDYVFPSQSGAGQFLNGTSFDRNGNWKTKDGTPLKALLK